MTDTTRPGGKPEKIAILGGGIAALTTAFELTSQPGWQDRYDITLHQLGWRLGGKCASSRGPNGRIQEHGIHAFMGSYYNAMPMMAALYKELGRQPGEPLATFEEAFLPESFVLMWEWRDLALRRWPMTFPRNDRTPADGKAMAAMDAKLTAVIDLLAHIFAAAPLEAAAGVLHEGSSLVEHVRGLIGRAQQAVACGAPHGRSHPLLDLLETVWLALRGLVMSLFAANDDIRRLFILADYIFALIHGIVQDDIATNGWDSIDDLNWSDWLLAHGAHPSTVSSPMALNTINLSYQYPTGDTTLAPRMAAGAYAHWTLRSFAFNGAIIYLFGAGTGETVIAPLYQVLRRRGVKFEFFHKVEALRLSADGQSVDSVEIAVQANLKDPAQPYEPLITVKGLPSWPDTPQFDQLVEGEALKAQGVDLESYWTPWVAPGAMTLKAGVDYDRLVFAISLGAVPFLCADLMAARPAWQAMVDAIPTVQTQTMQIWLSQTTQALGWDIPLAPGDTIVSDTYLNPGDGQADFSHLIALEDWPPDQTPKSLWYFCGLMSDHHVPAPFTDHTYPDFQFQRVRFQSIQYLQAGMGPLLPNATTNAQTPPGDPVGFDFRLLVEAGASEDPNGALRIGVARMDSQFIRANIDPTERYVTSPPGSTRRRLMAWDSGFANLVVAGDWIYTGINVGSVEGTVMSGKLASFAVSGYPPIADIIGFPANLAPPPA